MNNKNTEFNENPLKLIKNFKENDWLIWIEDILTFEIAFPFSKLSDNDVLIDVPKFLLNNKISTIYYEDALIHILSKFYGVNNYVQYINRVLDALIELKSNRTKVGIINLFLSSYLDDKEFLPVRMKAIQLLYRLDLVEEEKQKIELKLKALMFKNFTTEPQVVGYYLRFLRLQRTTKDFYSLIAKLSERTEQLMIDDNLLKRYCLVIFAKIEELHFHNSDIFFKDLFSWITNIRIEIFNTKLLRLVLDKLLLFFEYDTTKKNLKNPFTAEQQYYDALRFTLHSFRNSETFKNFELSYWSTAIDFFIHDGNSDFLKSIMYQNEQYLLKHIAIYYTEVFRMKDDNVIESIRPPARVILFLERVMNKINIDNKNAEAVFENDLSVFNNN